MTKTANQPPTGLAALSQMRAATVLPRRPANSEAPASQRAPRAVLAELDDMEPIPATVRQAPLLGC